MKYYPVIGLEIHVQLNTVTKLFCSCLNEYAPEKPNKNICPFCTGQPGALPLLNQSAVHKALALGVAVGGKIPSETRWDRKNYFYPDLPAGYQISQYDNPIVEGGKISYYVEHEGSKKVEHFTTDLTRAHLEADAGKLIHTTTKTLVDYNRSGAPLIEIVTEPQIHSSSQAIAFVQELQLIVRTLKISDGDMEKGQIRFDCNLSLQTETEYQENKLPSYKVEIKNINSTRSLGRAIEFEIDRQSKLLQDGHKPTQETRGWRDDLNKSVAQRSKELAHDYRYFPEPDLQILEILPSDIPTLESLPLLPSVRRKAYTDKGLSLQTANTLVTQEEVGEFFDAVLAMSEDPISDDLYRTIANIVVVNLLAQSSKLEKSISDLILPKATLEIASLFHQQKINNAALQTLISLLIEDPTQEVEKVVFSNNLSQISDDIALLAIVDVVLEANPQIVEQYKSGKIQVIGFLVGQCMKQSQGRGNPQKFQALLKERLDK